MTTTHIRATHLRRGHIVITAGHRRTVDGVATIGGRVHVGFTDGTTASLDRRYYPEVVRP